MNNTNNAAVPALFSVVITTAWSNRVEVRYWTGSITSSDVADAAAYDFAVCTRAADAYRAEAARHCSRDVVAIVPAVAHGVLA